MKKIKFIAIVAILCLAMASMAFAGATTLGGTGQVTTSFGGGIYKPSTAVTVKANSTATSYCATSQHSGAAGQSSGLQYGTLSNSPAIPSLAAAADGPTACSDAATLPNGM